jgi:hypothetical protein
VPPFVTAGGNPAEARASTPKACAGAASRPAHRHRQADAPPAVSAAA